MYSGVILDRFRHPTHQGTLDAPDASHEGVNPLCGDRIRVELRLRDGSVTRARFRAEACAICVASASLLMERIEGHELSAARDVTPDDVLAMLHAEIAPARLRCATLPLEVLRAALAGAKL
jgi:nitrogen fixation NifU-like protein